MQFLKRQKNALTRAGGSALLVAASYHVVCVQNTGSGCLQCFTDGHCCPPFLASRSPRLASTSWRSHSTVLHSYSPLPQVRYGNTVIVMPLQPGEQGKLLFEREVKKILKLPDSHVRPSGFGSFLFASSSRRRQSNSHLKPLCPPCRSSKSTSSAPLPAPTK